MANTVQLKKNGQIVYPITDRACIIGLNEGPLMEFIYAWDGSGTPVPANIPAGVTVTYDGNTYTGTLAASASTSGYIYLVYNPTSTEYDIYGTDATGGSYAWKAMGDTTIQSPDIADNLTTNDSTKALSAKQGKILNEEVEGLEAEVTDLDIKIFGLHESGNKTFSATGFASSVISGLNIKAGQTFKVKATSSDCDWTRLCVIDGTAWGGQTISQDYMMNGVEYFLTAVSDISVLSLYLFSANTFGTITLSVDINEDVDLDALNDNVAELDTKVNGKDNSASCSIPIVAGQANTYNTGAYADVVLKAGRYAISHDETILGDAPNFYVCYQGSNTYTLIDTIANITTLTLANDVWRVAVWAGSGSSLDTGDCLFTFTDKDAVIGLDERVGTLEDEIAEKLDSDILKQVYSKNLLNLNDPSRIQGGYINTLGELVTTPEAVALVCDMSPLIPFTQEQGKLTLSLNGGSFGRVWYGNICYYDSDKQFISATPYTTTPTNGTETATWFSGVAYVRFMLRHATEDINLYQVEVGETATPFVPYSTETQFDIPNLKVLSSQINYSDALPAISLCGLRGAVKEVANASNETINLTDWPQYIKSSNIVSVEAKITAFGMIAVGTGYGQSRSRYIKVDGTNVYFCSYGSEEGLLETVAHGLNIGTFIKVVCIIDGLDTTAIVSTIDGVFKHTNTRTGTNARESYGYPSLYLDPSTSLTEIKLNANCKKMQCPVWVFGDSIESEFVERWPYYLRYAWGFDYYLDALAGGTSAQLYSDLGKALAHGTPKYLVWMLGTNDIIANDIDSYKNYVTAIKDICTKNSVELILMKFPSFSTYDTTVVNAWMESQGFRYVDFYKAVGCETYGASWYPDYQNDGPHPTALGAKAEASQMCVDVPEIMQ